MCAGRVDIFLSQRAARWTSIKEKEHHVARRDAPAKEKENTEETARERARGDLPDHVSCVKDLTGLVSVLHIMVERVSVPSHLARDTRTLHRFDKLIWKAMNVTGSQAQVPLQLRFRHCRLSQVSTWKGSSFSTLEPRCP